MSTLLIILIVVLVVVNMAAGFELTDRLSNLEPEARGRIVWFLPFSAMFFASQHWEKVKYPLALWIVSGLLALLAVADLAFSWVASTGAEG